MIWYVPNNPCDDIDIYIYISAWTSFFVGGWPTKLETETQRSTKSKLFFEVTCQEVFVWGVDCLGEDLKNNNDAHISWMSLGFIDELRGDVEEAKNHWGLQRNQWDIYQITGQSNKPWDVPSFFWLPVWSLQTVCWCTLATGNFRKTPPMSQCQGICVDIYFWITWGSIIYIYIHCTLPVLEELHLLRFRLWLWHLHYSAAAFPLLQQQHTCLGRPSYKK